MNLALATFWFALVPGAYILVRAAREQGRTRIGTIYSRYGWALPCGIFYSFVWLVLMSLLLLRWLPWPLWVFLLWPLMLGLFLSERAAHLGHYRIHGSLYGTGLAAWRRFLLRLRWPSVARASGLANRGDRRPKWGLSSNQTLGAVVVEWLPALSHGRRVGPWLTYRMRAARGGVIDDVAQRSEQIASSFGCSKVEIIKEDKGWGLIRFVWDDAMSDVITIDTQVNNMVPWQDADTASVG